MFFSLSLKLNTFHLYATLLQLQSNRESIRFLVIEHSKRMPQVPQFTTSSNHNQQQSKTNKNNNDVENDFSQHELYHKFLAINIFIHLPKTKACVCLDTADLLSFKQQHQHLVRVCYSCATVHLVRIVQSRNVTEHYD